MKHDSRNGELKRTVDSRNGNLEEAFDSRNGDLEEAFDNRSGEELIECEEEHSYKFLENLNRKYNRISYARLGSFLVLAAGVILIFTEGAWWNWIIAVIGGIIFVLLLIKHGSISNQQQYVKHRLQVLEYMKKRESGNWYELPGTGAEFLHEENYVAKDLDLFGTHSLYQMICTAHTNMGKQRLAEVLQQAERADVDAAIITGRQQAVRELAEHRNFRIDFETLALEQEKGSAGKKTAENISEQQKPEVKKDNTSGLTILSVIAFAWPVLVILSFIGAIVHWWNAGVILVIYFAGLLFSWMTAGYCQKYTTDVFANRTVLQSNLHLMEAFARESFEADLLTRLQKQIKSEDKKNALYGMKRLERLLAAYNIRHNPIVHWLLCGICQYDIHLTRYALAWERQYGQCVQDSVHALAELEMLNSFAALAGLRCVCYPFICMEEQEPYIYMQKGYHPLLNPEQAVPNSIRLEARPQVITGSNMSGKTTFLRTIGMNAILAYAGAPVCAEYMKISVMRPFTSMRITDDVNQGISTFYAEILRIKEMVEYSSQKQPMLCLIDEIFKGTNSADRIVGAEAVIRKLTKSHIIAMISTHDFELCRLADNYHFEEFYNNGGIQFDYLLREGMCKTTNALHLLKLAGLTED